MPEQIIEIVGRDGRRRRAKPGETLADGETFSIPARMAFFDAAREVADHLRRKYGAGDAVIRDSSGAAAGHRPGYCVLATADARWLHDAARVAYEERNKRLVEAHKRRDAAEPERQLPVDRLADPDPTESAWLRKQALAREAAKPRMFKPDAMPTLDQLRADAASSYEARNRRLDFRTRGGSSS